MINMYLKNIDQILNEKFTNLKALYCYFWYYYVEIEKNHGLTINDKETIRNLLSYNLYQE